jgi:hypothetical protein
MNNRLDSLPNSLKKQPPNTYDLLQTLSMRNEEQERRKETFLAAVEQMKVYMDDIFQATVDIEHMHVQTPGAAATTGNLRRNMRDLIVDNNDKAKAAKASIESLKIENDQWKEMGEIEANELRCVHWAL